MSAEASQRLVLARDLGEFLIELSIALQRSAMYPSGHPSLDQSARNVMTRVAALLAERAELSIGVARRQLVIEGVATDARNPVLQSLAERLHRHYIGALTLRRGVTGGELLDVLSRVAQDPLGGERALGLGDPSQLRRWSGIELHVLSYDQLELLDEADGEAASDDQPDSARPAQLWIGLARAALATREEIADESADPAAVAQAINERAGARAYDQVIVGYMLQIARELRSDDPAALRGGGSGSDRSSGSAPLRRRMSRLLAGLDGATLARLLEMGGNEAQRHGFLSDAVDGFAADAVVELVQAAASTKEQTVSSSMVRLLTKLATYSEASTDTVSMRADTALRDQVRELMRDWQLSDPNPTGYTDALDALTRALPAAAPAATSFEAEPWRIVQLGLETGATGASFWRSCDALLEGEQGGELVSMLIAAPDSPASDSLRRWLLEPSRLLTLLVVELPDMKVLWPLLRLLPQAACVDLLLEALAESPHRSGRLVLLEQLAGFGSDAVSAVAARLSDDRWFVVRNALYLLHGIGVVPADVSIVPFARHSEGRVREAAIRLLLRSADERERGLCMALADADERVLRLAMLPYAGDPGEIAVGLIAKRLAEPALSADTRVRLLQLLGQSSSARALDVLLRTAAPGRTILGLPKLSPRRHELIAALTALAGAWSAEPRVQPVLKRARRSSDSAIRLAASGGS